jgi:hypothetical protein
VSLVHVLAIVAMRSYGSGRRGDSFRVPTVAGTRNVPTSGAPLEHAHRRRCASVPLVSSVSPRSATLRGLDDPVRLPRCDGRMCCLLLHRDRHDEALRAPRLIGPSACRLLRSRSASTAARAADRGHGARPLEHASLRPVRAVHGPRRRGGGGGRARAGRHSDRTRRRAPRLRRQGPEAPRAAASLQRVHASVALGTRRDRRHGDTAAEHRGDGTQPVVAVPRHPPQDRGGGRGHHPRAAAARA